MRFVKNFQNNTSFAKDKELIEIPEFDPVYNYPNLLFEKNILITGGRISQSCIISRKEIKVKAELLNADGSNISPGFVAYYPIVLWIISKINGLNIPTFTSVGLGNHTINMDYDLSAVNKSYKLNIYYNDMSTPKVSRNIKLN
jgi:hypothetical protein